MEYYLLVVPPLAVAYAIKPLLGWAVGLATLAVFLAVGAVEAHSQNYTGLVDLAGRYNGNSK